MAQMTKKALAASLKKLLEQKPLSKITVTDIAEDCEINRHTFYYHFRDIYDLVEWIFCTEAEKAIGGNNTYDTWQQGVERLFKYALDNKKFILGTFRSVSKEQLMFFLKRQLFRVVNKVVEEQAVHLDISEKERTFVAEFYTYTLSGIMLSWIEKDMKQDPEEIRTLLFTMMQGELDEVLQRFVKQ